MSDKNKNRTTEYVARGVVGGTIAGISASMYYADKKPKNMVPKKSKGLKTPTAKSIAKVESRLLNTTKIYSEVANQLSVNTGGKTKVGYSPKQGKMVREPAYNPKTMEQINKSWLTGKNQMSSKGVPKNIKSLSGLDKRTLFKFNEATARLGNRTRRIGAAMDSPKNKAIRTMGKVLNVVRGGSAIGALSYAASSTPVGDATIHKGFKQKAFKKSDRPLKLPK
jgi:hypothetical protein